MSSELGDLGHARAGDKGDTSIIGVILYDLGDFARVRRSLTAERIAAHFKTTTTATTVIPLESLGAFTVVIRDRLDGGVTRSAGVDPHGKSLSSHLLELRIE